MMAVANVNTVLYVGNIESVVVVPFLTVKENGKEAYNGLKMLLYQGVEAFELWNDVAVSKETADRIYQRMEQELSGK